MALEHGVCCMCWRGFELPELEPVELRQGGKPMVWEQVCSECCKKVDEAARRRRKGERGGVCEIEYMHGWYEVRRR